MEEQPGREFASANPTKGTQDAALQERWLSPEIPFDACRRLQHFQCPTPSHVSRNAPKFSRCGDEHVARGRCGRLKLTSRNLIAFFIRQCDKASRLSWLGGKASV